MPHPDTLTIVHHDDTQTTYTQIIGYQLHRDGDGPPCSTSFAGGPSCTDVLAEEMRDW